MNVPFLARARIAHVRNTRARCRPVRRRPFDFVAFLFLVLGVAVAALWGWNRWFIAQASFPGTAHEAHVVARPSGIYLAWARLQSPQPPAAWTFGTYAARPEDFEPLRFPWDLSALGFYAGIFAGASNSHTPCTVRYLIVPHWFLMALAAIVPAAWIWRQERLLRRRNRGQCPCCGYDVRATPGRCPECGTAVRVVLAFRGAALPSASPTPRSRTTNQRGHLHLRL